jgi:hypothetical protein
MVNIAYKGQVAGTCVPMSGGTSVAEPQYRPFTCWKIDVV